MTESKTYETILNALWRRGFLADRESMTKSVRLSQIRRAASEVAGYTIGDVEVWVNRLETHTLIDEMSQYRFIVNRGEMHAGHECILYKRES